MRKSLLNRSNSNYWKKRADLLKELEKIDEELAVLDLINKPFAVGVQSVVNQWRISFMGELGSMLK